MQVYRFPLQLGKNIVILFKNYVSTHMYSYLMLKSVSLALNIGFGGLGLFLEWKLPTKCVKKTVLAFELFFPSY